MKRRFLVGATFGVLIGLLACATALAFNPQPEPPAKVNKLDEIGTVLEGISLRLGGIASMPNRADRGLAGKLEAVANQIQVQGRQLQAALAVCMEPGDDEELVLEAVGHVRNYALDIATNAEGMMDPGDDERVAAAKLNVYDSAMSIVNMVDGFLSVYH